MKIVLGGSRQLSFLPDDVMENLDSWMRDDAQFLLGEAKGTDAKFQEYFKFRKYKNIQIFYSGDFPRHNFGDWPTLKIESGLKSKSHAMHAAKDREMTALADTGLMMWDTLSAGTLSNILDLLDQGKACQMYVAGDDSHLYYLNNLGDTSKWREKYPEVFEEATKRLRTYAKRASKNSPETEQTLF
jgi:DNA-binding ferritin-like protein (Dps family)